MNWLTGLVLGKKENREYLQKVNGANREIVYAVRPGISEGDIPSREVLTSLRNATARRYSVEATSLYSPQEIAEELTKEVMDSSFISSSQKQQYCQQLTGLVQDASTSTKAELSDTGNLRIVTAEYRERFISMTGALLGVLTVTLTISISSLQLFNAKKLDSLFVTKDIKSLESFLPLIATAGTMLVTTAMLPFLREFARHKRRDTEPVQFDGPNKRAAKSGAIPTSIARKPPSREA